MNDLKNYQKKELPLFIISNILIFLIVHQIIKIDTIDCLHNTAKIISQVFVSTILSAIAFGFILVIECLFTSGFKEKLLYLFGFFGFLNLPGCTIFTEIREKNGDNRFSYQDVVENYPELYQNLPEDGKGRSSYENEKWYTIYSQNRDVPMIQYSQRDWLLCRDIYISTLVMIFSYVVVAIMRFVDFNYQYILFLIFEAGITNFGANRKAVRFAYNVIAYDVTKTQKNEKSNR